MTGQPIGAALGAMQDWDLRVTHLIDHAAREHGSREIVTRWADGSETRIDWAGIRHDALRMTQALRRAVGIHEDFVARRFSPGGCADLLAATLFVHALQCAWP